MHHDLRRADVNVIIARAAARTQGSYRALLEFLKIKPTEQRRFLAFLSKYGCRIPGVTPAGLGAAPARAVLAGTASEGRVASV
jgi:hypothetical protein